MSAIRTSLVALVIFGGLGCAGVDDSATPVGGRDAAAGVMSEVRKAAEQPPCHASNLIDLDPRPTDMLILLDRSGSMETAFGSGSRYQALATLLGDLVTTYQQHIRFGYMEMPGRSGCEGQAVGCCASPPSVELAPDNAPAVLAAIANAAPVEGNTPTASALLQAKTYYDALDDGVNNRFVLLATDGVPDCTLSGTLSQGAGDVSSACLDALAEVQGLVAAGAKVIVLSVADEGAASTGGTNCLDTLAHAGGAAISPGSPGYYSVATPEQLRTAIEQSFGAEDQPSCVVKLPSVDTSRPVIVELDGNAIPNDLYRGWHFDYSLTQPAIRVTGEYCDRIQTFQFSSFEVEYSGCEMPAPP